jgi:hypothetical protein
MSDPTYEGRRSTALWTVFITGHDICFGRIGKRSFVLKGTAKASAELFVKHNPRRRAKRREKIMFTWRRQKSDLHLREEESISL